MTIDLHTTPHRKDEIGASLIFAFMQMEEYIQRLSEEDMQIPQQGKWSPEQQMQHLIRSAGAVALSINLPKFVLLPFGKDDNTASRSYGDISESYHDALFKGAKSSYVFQPARFVRMGKNRILSSWRIILDNIKSALYLYWNEVDLDTYRMPHPILGMLTIREMLFFTIYHTLYHLNSMKTVYGDMPKA